ncbi:O-antigen ligase family protein [Vibrio alginolyticus]|nr:O-antigen ligase family protein [Vibrio alginolyticus]
MRIIDYNSVDLRIAITILFAAFLNFENPALGAFLCSFIELCIINIIYSSHSLNNRKKISLYNKVQLLTVTSFILLISISTLLLLINSTNKEQMIFGFIRYLQINLHIVTSILISMYFFHKPQEDKLFSPIPIAILLAGLICLLDYHFNSETVMSNNSTELPVSYNIRQIGYVVMLGCLFCIVKLVSAERKSKQEKLYIILFLMNCSMLFWLGGRGATLALTASIILLVTILHKEFIDKCKFLFSIVILMVLSYLISIPFSVFSWNGANRFYALSQHLDMPLSKMSTGRIDLWRESISLILQKPFFGYGPEAHAYTTKIGFLQPHNSILQSLLEFGVLGTIPFLIILTYLVKNATINAIEEPTVNNLFCFSLIVSIFIHSLYSGPFYHATSMILVCIASAYILSITLQRKTTKQRNKKSQLVSKT